MEIHWEVIFESQKFSREVQSLKYFQKGVGGFKWEKKKLSMVYFLEQQYITWIT